MNDFRIKSRISSCMLCPATFPRRQGGGGLQKHSVPVPPPSTLLPLLCIRQQDACQSHSRTTAHLSPPLSRAQTPRGDVKCAYGCTPAVQLQILPAGKCYWQYSVAVSKVHHESSHVLKWFSLKLEIAYTDTDLVFRKKRSLV